MPSEVDIFDVRTIPSVMEGRMGKLDKLVFYRVEGRTYTVRLPEEAYSVKAAEAAIRKDVDERTKTIAHKFTV